MKRCHQCKTPWISEKKEPAVKEYCEHCSAYLHCCLNCHFYDPTRHNECAIPTTDWVADKAGANFCDEFQFREDAAQDGNGEEQQARKKLGLLFGEDPPESGSDALDAFRNL